MQPLVVLVEFLARAYFTERFGELIAANARASLEHETGCRRFDILVDPEEPRRFVLYEIYDDGEAFELHLRSAHYRSFAEAVKDGIEARSIRKLGFFAPTATSPNSA